MLKSLMNNYKNLDKLTYKIMKNGLIFCFVLCIISVVILFTYEVYITSPSLYYIGLILFKLSINFGIEFVVCGLVVDSIKKQLI